MGLQAGAENVICNFHKGVNVCFLVGNTAIHQPSEGTYRRAVILSRLSRKLTCPGSEKATEPEQMNIVGNPQASHILQSQFLVLKHILDDRILPQLYHVFGASVYDPTRVLRNCQMMVTQRRSRRRATNIHLDRPSRQTVTRNWSVLPTSC